MSVAVNNFSSILNQMRDNYKGDTLKDFSLAEFIGLQSISLSDASAEIIEATKNHEQNLNNFHLQQEADLLTNVQSLENDKDQSSFMRKMNENRAKAKENANAMIDKYYDKIEDIGNKNPNQQTVILLVAQKVGEFMNEIMNKIMEVFTSVIATVTKAISKAIDYIASSFKSIANTAKNFFSSLF
ncbi:MULTISPECIES: hypothetical protein [Lysinibacillus]|uniref:LXG domain-containing protein n=2 Tax=Lysinibacillus TaxID=400634 RepID=A0ABY2T9W5_9BACI|nr:MULTISPECIES: hypothetical protein [Lysinibacillus]AHN24498.1 hypothetical protein T479_20590 [Lysinibacillus varians]TKI45673.1 hypothetical protein FC748_18820 [Lysinibacillus tabacifolii]TKI61031.1 hypothetical protein FC752_14685 [Lysinibacillus varians]